MPHTAHFRFYDTLNDFLKAGDRHRWLAYTFPGSPAVKDAFEAIGIPHPEVALVVVNGQPSAWSRRLLAADQVEIYPFNSTLGPRPLPPHVDRRPCTFVLDVHLGRLARLLRLLGFDSLYENHLADGTLARIAAAEQRIVLTRDIGLLKHGIIERGYWLRAQQPAEQLQEVLRHFRLAGPWRPFTRCLACNGSIERVEKERVLSVVPPATARFYHEFFQCQACRRVYWKGSHYAQMQALLQQIEARTGFPTAPGTDRNRLSGGDRGTV